MVAAFIFEPRAATETCGIAIQERRAFRPIGTIHAGELVFARARKPV